MKREQWTGRLDSLIARAETAQQGVLDISLRDLFGPVGDGLAADGLAADRPAGDGPAADGPAGDGAAGKAAGAEEAA